MISRDLFAKLKLMKKAVFGGILSILFVIAYLFFTDFSLVKKFVGYNAPEFKEPEIASVDGERLPFLDIPEGFEISIVAKGL